MSNNNGNANGSAPFGRNIKQEGIGSMGTTPIKKERFNESKSQSRGTRSVSPGKKSNEKNK
ncbi:hypothetical protein [Domibacillus mangrovi]|uniref:Uncharacterized protein n=1 Tax=Domibacillus mangrovi TaxID=1714354 RepID=A0A1Q5P356_9BACI|nr:hypothetical protein [Domibacillus mangrovi]OKL36690.1 hypothetical protein BLL40_08100 [Domibacillus mangrovi]